MLWTDAWTHARTDGQGEKHYTHHKFKIMFSEPNSLMHMFNVSTLHRKSIEWLHQKLW